MATPPPLPPPLSSPLPRLDLSERVEEETLPYYDPDHYYPMRIGDVLKDRYQVVAKLGFGSASTVWLCRDLWEHCYRAIKVHVHTQDYSRERKVLKHLAGITKEHPGRMHVRQLEDSFKMRSCNGKHDFSIIQPLGKSMERLQELQGDGILSQSKVKKALDQALLGLSFLHEAGVIHTDIHAENLLIATKDDSIFSLVEETEIRTPSERKYVGDRIIYRSYWMAHSLGRLVISSLGQARIVTKYRGDAMHVPYRAPEVILGMEWDSAVDIWSLGLVSWDFLARESLFRRDDSQSKELNDAHHLAAMTKLMGDPPPGFLKRSKETRKYWDADGKWIGPVPLPESIEGFRFGLTNLVEYDRDEYLGWLSLTLCWLPELRLTAEEAYDHRWLRGSRAIEEYLEVISLKE